VASSYASDGLSVRLAGGKRARTPREGGNEKKGPSAASKGLGGLRPHLPQLVRGP
jgi:hypothetical protein